MMNIDPETSLMSTHAVARTFYWFYASTNKNVEKYHNNTILKAHNIFFSKWNLTHWIF